MVERLPKKRIDLSVKHLAAAQGAKYLEAHLANSALGVRGLRHPSPLPGGSRAGIRRLCLVGLVQASVGVMCCV